MELHSLHIKILNTLKSSADGMTKHEIEKNIGQKFITAYIDTLKKYGYVEIAGTKDGYKQIIYPDGDIENISTLSFAVYKIADGKW